NAGRRTDRGFEKEGSPLAPGVGYPSDPQSLLAVLQAPDFEAQFLLLTRSPGHAHQALAVARHKQPDAGVEPMQHLAAGAVDEFAAEDTPRLALGVEVGLGQTPFRTPAPKRVRLGFLFRHDRAADLLLRLEVDKTGENQTLRRPRHDFNGHQSLPIGRR